MIPIQLKLQHFLSYQSAVLDLEGVHTACICGANGAGKSSLLDALTWGIWGQSRVGNDQDLIHAGAMEAAVTVIYQSRGQRYRVLRTRTRSGSGSLEWQIQTGSGWRALTQKGIRATQGAIQAQLRLDYETFINSAYLRQGRADEFTLKRPSERKQILAEILKLGQYEQLAERSRERFRATKVQLQIRQEQLAQTLAQQAQLAQIEQAQACLKSRHQEVQQLYHQAQEHLHQLHHRRQRRLDLQQRYQDLTEQLAQLSTVLEEQESQWQQQRQYQRDLEELMACEHQILAGCRRYQELWTLDRQLHQGFLHRQSLQWQGQTLQTQLAHQRQQSWQALQSHQTQLATLKARQRMDDQILQHQEQIESTWHRYRQARSELRAWQRQQERAAPWFAQYQECLDQKHQVREQLIARRDLLHHQIDQLQQEQAQIRQVEHQAVAVQVEVLEWEQRRHYHHQVQEKLQERRLFVHQLQERQRTLQRQWQQLQEKQVPIDPVPRPLSSQASAAPLCPLCERPLDAHLITRVLHRQQEEQEEVTAQMLVIREQLAVADREIQVLMEEDQALAQALQGRDHHLFYQGRLQHQLETHQTHQWQLRCYQQELQELDQCLAQDTYAPELQQRLQQLQQALAQIGYDEQHHAQCREQVERWRWVESKQIELQRARQRGPRLQQQIHQVEQQIQALQAEEAWTDDQGHSLLDQLHQIEQQLSQVEYDSDHHQQVRSELEQAQVWLAQWQALQQVRHQYPLCKTHCEALLAHLHHSRQTLVHLSQELELVHEQLQQLPPVSEAQIESLSDQIQHHRQELDELLAQLGAVQQQWQHLHQLADQSEYLTQQVQGCRRLVQVHQELAHAFGRNGIPALILETVLPALESEANQILARLSEHQLHLQFVTQRSSRRSQKPIDTLDILIADPRGTRPYETYSGGEAFRINFAIRLALSRLLAQRSGAHLQTLLIDEGFGTQDPRGRQHLVAAIDAVAADFARILVITHIPTLQDAFPHRIEVYKGTNGSQLRVRS